MCIHSFIHPTMSKEAKSELELPEEEDKGSEE